MSIKARIAKLEFVKYPKPTRALLLAFPGETLQEVVDVFNEEVRSSSHPLHGKVFGVDDVDFVEIVALEPNLAGQM